MILADKIIEERKRNGMSQEELAEKLDVSRQSVSKWEGAQSIPDITRIIKMAEIFGVTTDYLLKDDEARPESEGRHQEETESTRGVRMVSMEEATEFIAFRKKQAPSIALATVLCILSPVVLIIMAGFSESPLYGISEKLAVGIGISVLFVLVAIAVFIFIRSGHDGEKFEYLEKEEIETAYGVSGLAKEKRAQYDSTYKGFLTGGIMLCVLSPLPLIICALITEETHIVTILVGVLLAMVAAGAYFIIRVSMVKGAYDVLLQEGDYEKDKKKSEPIVGRIAGIYWPLAAAIFLGISFISNSWDRSWIVWPIAGVLYAVVVGIVKAVYKPKN